MNTNIAELRQKAKLPANRAGGNTVAEFFQANKSSMAAVLPRHADPERMTKIALTALRTTPKLMECTVQSLMGAVMQCATMGLEPNTVLGHAYLVPFNNKKAQRTDVQVIIGYKGLLDLARRSGQIQSIAAHAVCENDEFDFAYGIEEKLHHKPALNGRGNIIAFYAVAHLVGGGYAYEVLSNEQVQAIMAGTQSGGRYGPWRDFYEEMGRKTAIRRLAKYLPLSVEFATAVAVDAMAEHNQDQRMGDVLSGDWTAVREPERPEPDRSETDAINASIGAGERQVEIEQQPAGTQASPSDYPIRQDDNWIDANGEAFDAEQHGWNRENNAPSVTSAGVFRRRKGTVKAESEQDNGGMSAADDLVNQAKSAQYPADLDDIAQAAKEFDGPDREKIEAAVQARRSQITGNGDVEF